MRRKASVKSCMLTVDPPEGCALPARRSFTAGQGKGAAGGRLYLTRSVRCSDQQDYEPLAALSRLTRAIMGMQCCSRAAPGQRIVRMCSCRHQIATILG